MSSTTNSHIQHQVKEAMRAKDKPRLGVLRLITAAIKQYEVDQRVEVDDKTLITILNKLVKQRRESISQYQQAHRDDLVEQEQYELTVIQEFLPQPLSELEVNQYIQTALDETGASSIKDMAQVMAALKDKLHGRADMAEVSKKVKQQLS